MKACEKGLKFIFSLLRVMGQQLYLLHGSWEIHLLPFGTTSIFISISGIKGSHWAKAHWLWDWNGSCQQIGFGGTEATGTQTPTTLGPNPVHIWPAWISKGPDVGWIKASTMFISGTPLGVFGYC